MGEQDRVRFVLPDTDQGRNIKRVVDDVFMNVLPNTESGSLFKNLMDRPPLYAMHRREVAGAIIALANGTMTDEEQYALSRIHHDVEIAAEQFQQVSAILLGRLAEAGEMGVVDTLQDVLPQMREVWVRN